MACSPGTTFQIDRLGDPAVSDSLQFRASAGPAEVQARALHRVLPCRQQDRSLLAPGHPEAWAEFALLPTILGKLDEEFVAV
jgi:hypothetical protein